ncbi:MAG TPA: hemolysin family protein [Rhodothermales bacterium]
MIESLLILLALIVGAILAGAEVAYAAANRLRVEVEARRSGIVGPIVRRYVEDPSRFLGATLAGGTVALVVFATLLALRLRTPIERLFAESLLWPAGLSFSASVLILALIATVLAVVFMQILPKSVAHEVANRTVFALAVPLRILHLLFLPLSRVASAVAARLVRPRASAAESLEQFLRRDFEVIVRENRPDGQAGGADEETELVTNVLALSGLRVRESMVPRTDIEAIEEGTTIEQVRARMIETGLSKLPVYRENIDHIIGVVFAYDLFQDPASLAEIVKPIKFVPESKRSKDLLREFLASNASIAIVIDEYGGTAGLVTREDLLEELFGDIQDEFDIEEFAVRQTSANTFTVNGRVDVDELADRFGLVFPKGDYETLAGYLLERIGTIPSVRQEFVIDGYRFVILKATPNRIDLVRIVRLSPEAAS